MVVFSIQEKTPSARSLHSPLIMCFALWCVCVCVCKTKEGVSWVLINKTILYSCSLVATMDTPMDTTTSDNTTMNTTTSDNTTQVKVEVHHFYGVVLVPCLIACNVSICYTDNHCWY